MRYLVTARVKPGREADLLRAIEDGTLGAGSVAGEEYLRNMEQARLCAQGKIRWVEVCFCDLPLQEERPYWEEYFDLVRVQDAHARQRCRDLNGSEAWACCACDCTQKLEKKLAEKGQAFLEVLGAAVEDAVRTAAMNPAARCGFFFFFLIFLGALTALATGPVASPAYPDKSKLLVWRDEAGKERPVKTAADWAKRRAHILANMEKVMGPLLDPGKKVPLDVKYVEEVKTPRFIRKKLTFAVGKNERVPGYLLLPVDIKGKVAGILCLHQTNGALGSKEPAGLGGNPNLHYAVHLAERGYVTLAPDYPSFGEYPFDFQKSGFASGSMKAIWNNMRAVDLLQALPDVDGSRIGCIGHSLGGHNAMFTAAFDRRIKALVSNCGFTSFPKYYKGNLRGWTSDRYMPRIAKVYDLKPDKVPFDFPEVVAAFAPRAFLASSPLHDGNFEVSGVKDCIAAARPVFELLGAGDKLSANYPDCAHDFPADVRKTAYEFLDRWLKGGSRP